ncbi:MAG: HlyC/CorC family transporter [Rhodospirillaceae bacterium]|jgi:magnesium and cobalt transporter|nr:HlyC/CorC family transporter [Rhodospirillaceae bacterium]MBT6118409.1 HlyC/CorC family transporter [Rhodospirillaceae bacterium]
MSEDGDPRQDDLRAGLRRRWRLWRRGRPGESALRDSLESLIEGYDDENAVVEGGERAILRNVLKLHELTVDDVMVPRADIVAIEAGTGLTDLIAVMTDRAHSRMPVYRGSLDDVIGVVHIKDVLPYWDRKEAFNLHAVLREALFVAPSMRVLDLLLQMRLSRVHMALVVDEFGGIDGLVSIEDLVEEIVGEIEDEHEKAEGPRLDLRSDGTVIADARAELEEFEALAGPHFTADEREESDTLGGLVFSLAGRVPGRGELIAHPSGLEFEVLEADPRRVRRLRVRNLPDAEQA